MVFGHQRSSLYVRLFTFSYINSLTYLVNPTKRENSDTNRIVAGVWGLVAGAALILIGAAVGYFVRVPQRLIAAIMAFGNSILISALVF